MIHMSSLERDLTSVMRVRQRELAHSWCGPRLGRCEVITKNYILNMEIMELKHKFLTEVERAETSERHRSVDYPLCELARSGQKNGIKYRPL